MLSAFLRIGTFIPTLGLFVYFAGVMASIAAPEFAKVSQEKEIKAKEENHKRESEKRRFLEECRDNNCTDFSKEKNVVKAKLIADKYSLSYPNGIQELYYRVERQCETADVIKAREVKEERLKKLRKEEQENYNKLNLYVHLWGRNKKIVMLSDIADEYQKSAKALAAGGSALIAMTQQRESNSGFWGGIADGLAGPAAGLATALDVEAKNRQIRASNQANLNAVAPLYMHSLSGSYTYEEKAQAIERLIEQTQVKLVEERPPADILSSLNITNPIVEVSETGAFYVKATVEAKEDFYIYEATPAVADGTITAHIWEGIRQIGTAQMVLPIDGTARKTDIIGMGLSGAYQARKYTVTFSATNLWLIEQ